MENEQLIKAGKYYDDNIVKAQECAERIKYILTGCLFEKDFYSIETRVKDKESYLKKCDKRNEDKTHKYNSHEEITDLVGIRVVANTMSDVNEICEIIKDEFYIDENKSINKADELKTDRVGYLSVHYIAKLNKGRSKQTEYSRIKEFSFEIQVRTLLQHAWSEIEHDRSYKFDGGKLGDSVKRKFNLIAGTLELLDMQFDELANKVQVHSDKVEKQVKNEEYDIPIDIASLEEYMKKKFGEGESYLNDDDLEVLNYMGLNKISDIENIIPENFYTDLYDTYNANSYHTYYKFILIDILVIFDIEKYKRRCNEMMFFNTEIQLYKKYGVDTNKHFKDIVGGLYEFKN